MSKGNSSGFRWKLARDTPFDTWQIQFKAFLSTKGLRRWLSETPTSTTPEEVQGDEDCKSHIILAMKDAALIRLASSHTWAKHYWEAISEDFQGRMRIRKHEIVREERGFAQKKNESFVDYCDRAAALESRMTLAGVNASNLTDFVICGLSAEFRTNNIHALTKIAHEQSSPAKALEEVLAYIRLYSRLSPSPRAADGNAFAANGKPRKFPYPCHYCGVKGHMQRDCRKKKRDESKGAAPEGQRRDNSRPAAALVCKSHAAEVKVPSALSASSNDKDGIILYDSCCTHHIVTDANFLMNLLPSRVDSMHMGGNEAHKVEGQGTAVLVGGPLGHVLLQEALYVPTMIHNLFSRGQALERGVKEEADEHGFMLRRADDTSTSSCARRWKAHLLPQHREHRQSGLV